MPTSPYAHLYTIVEFLNNVRPASILDVGVGNGKIGFIARDLLDVMVGERGKYKKEDWKIKIDGIEIFPEYIQDHQRAIYDHIYIGDAFDVIDTLGTYDMIVLGDVLEHFEKSQAHRFVDKCIAHSNKHMVVCTPLGAKWTQSEVYGKLYDKHLSSWSSEELKPLACYHNIFQYAPGAYGAFLIQKEDYIDCKLKALNSNDKKNISNSNDSLRKKFALNKENVSNIDLAKFSRYVANREHRNYFFDVNFKEHYRLIAYLSTLFDHSHIFDIGTNLGYSALALSYHHSNKIISYDIVECKDLNHAEELSNIEYLIGDILKDERLLGAPLIMLDTNHDGIFENKLYNYLKANNYKGLLFLDDIHINQPMRHFWNSISTAKDDITDLGHWSGSGLVDFSL
jgi:hypothetical protein